MTIFAKSLKWGDTEIYEKNQPSNLITTLTDDYLSLYVCVCVCVYVCVPYLIWIRYKRLCPFPAAVSKALVEIFSSGMDNFKAYPFDTKCITLIHFSLPPVILSTTSSSFDFFTGIPKRSFFFFFFFFFFSPLWDSFVIMERRTHSFKFNCGLYIEHWLNKTMNQGQYCSMLEMPIHSAVFLAALSVLQSQIYSCILVINARMRGWDELGHTLSPCIHFWPVALCSTAARWTKKCVSCFNVTCLPGTLAG